MRRLIANLFALPLVPIDQIGPLSADTHDLVPADMTAIQKMFDYVCETYIE
ncbi:unnamed protein product, partial [Didymodactylos carnosus]